MPTSGIISSAFLVPRPRTRATFTLSSAGGSLAKPPPRPLFSKPNHNVRKLVGFYSILATLPGLARATPAPASSSPSTLQACLLFSKPEEGLFKTSVLIFIETQYLAQC